MAFLIWMIKKLNQLVRWACWMSCGGVFGLAFFQIISRYLLKIPTPWTEEAARYLMIWMALLASGLAFQKGDHFNFDIITSRLKQRYRKPLILFTNFLTLPFLGCLIFWGISQAKLGFFTLSPGLQITMFIPYLALPVSSLIMVLNLFLHSYTVYQKEDQRIESEE